MTNSNSDITLTAVDYGARGNLISVTYVNPSANSQSLFVRVNGYDIVVHLATNSGGTIISTATLVAAAINAHAAASALVVATVEGSGAGVVNALAKDSLIGGVTCTQGVYMRSLMLDAYGNPWIKNGLQSWSSISGLFRFTGTLTWAGTHAAQELGLNIIPDNAFIEHIVGVVSGTVIADIIAGDGSDTDHWIEITTDLAAGTYDFTVANKSGDGTHKKFVVDPDANFTGSIAFTIWGRLLG